MKAKVNALLGILSLLLTVPPVRNFISELYKGKKHKNPEQLAKLSATFMGLIALIGPVMLALGTFGIVIPVDPSTVMNILTTLNTLALGTGAANTVRMSDTLGFNSRT